MIRRIPPCVAIVLGVLGWAGSARSNRVHYETVTLADMVGKATLIVVAKRATPPLTTEPISIAPPDMPTDPRKFPPYDRVKSRWLVEEVLKGDRSFPRGTLLEVDQADWHGRLGLHRRFHLEGVSKSPIYRRYEGAKSPVEEQAILFLTQDETGWRFVVERARESIARTAEVKRLLNRRP